METLHSVHQSFNKEIQNLQKIQYAMGKDIEDIKVEQESLSVSYRMTSQQVEALENQVAKLSIQNKDVRYLFMLPDSTEWFSDRELELENLHSLLRDANEHEVKIASVCGLGGNGKTSLDAEYAHRWKDFYDGGVFWFSGEDELMFANSVDDLAVFFGTLLDTSPDRTLVKTLEVISKIKKPWLIVLDDMDEYNLCSNIGMLLSGPWKRRVKGSGHILITTRRKPKIMTETIRAQDASSASLYQTRERLAVRTTWLVNFEYIKKSKNGDYAVRFLHACAFFSPTEIQQELINRGKPPIGDDAYRDYVDAPLGSSHIFKLLTDFSLFKKSKRSSLAVHRLVQEVVRENFKSDDEKVLSLIDAISMLSFAFSKCPSPDDLLSGDIAKHQDRISNIVINPSLFYPWRKFCLHAQEILSIINSFHLLDERILIPETAKIVYDCALDFNISNKHVEARHSVNFAHKIISLRRVCLTKVDQKTLFPHELPLPESVRRYIFYSYTTPADSCTSDKNARTRPEAKMKQLHAQGNIYFNSGNVHKAIEFCSSAMAVASSFDLKILCDRALAYINLHQYRDALADSEKYLLQRPVCWLGYAMKALALHGLNMIWDASRFAALAFCHNQNVFRDYQPFIETFSALERRIYICNCSTLLTYFLFKPVSDSQAASEIPGKIIEIEPGDYNVNVDHYPMTSPFFIIRLPYFALSIDDCIFLGVDNSKSSVVVRFNELVCICGRQVMAANVSFVFTLGNWENQPRSITTWLNCAFTSSLEESQDTFLSWGTDTFRNCSFENSQSPGLTVIAGTADVEKCVFSGGEYSGVHVSTCGILEIKESKLHGNETGIYITNAPTACNITNCEIFDNKWNGICVTEYTSNVRVENCRIYHSDRHGILVDKSSSVSASNNKVFENGWLGIATITNGRCTLSNNKIYGNKSGGVQVVPVGPNKGMPSIVEFNEIFDNRGHGIYCEMMVEDTPRDTMVSVSEGAFEQSMYYNRNPKQFQKAKCRENICYNNDSTFSSTAPIESRIDADFCFYCRKKCSK
ncbi:Small glutamine-rich tetratricopeptide repeat-containing alpha, partial [Paramuricea clavata]